MGKLKLMKFQNALLANIRRFYSYFCWCFIQFTLRLLKLNENNNLFSSFVFKHFMWLFYEWANVECACHSNIFFRFYFFHFYHFTLSHSEPCLWSCFLQYYSNPIQKLISKRHFIVLFHTFFCIKLRMTNEKHAMLLICHISLDFWVWILNHQSSLPIWILFFNFFFAFLTSQSNRTKKKCVQKVSKCDCVEKWVIYELNHLPSAFSLDKHFKREKLMQTKKSHELKTKLEIISFFWHVFNKTAHFIA